MIKSVCNHTAALLVAMLPGLFLAGCGSADEDSPGKPATNSAATVVPLGEYRCYLHRGEEDAPPAFRNENYQGYLNVLPGRHYEWKLDLDTRGEFAVDEDSGEITWLTGIYATGRNSGRFFNRPDGASVILVRSQSQSAAPVGLDCLHHKLPGR